jgi:hypothetical protein
MTALTWVQTDSTIAAIQAAVAENPQQSMRQPARHHRMDQRTMRSLVKEDLDKESHVIIKVPVLTPLALKMRKERCQ